MIGLNKDFKKWYRVNREEHGRAWALMVAPLAPFIVPGLKRQLEEADT